MQWVQGSMVCEERGPSTHLGSEPLLQPATHPPPPIPRLYDLFYEPGLAASTLPWEPAWCRLLAAQSEIGNFKSETNPEEEVGGGEGAPKCWGSTGPQGCMVPACPLCSAPVPICHKSQGLHTWEIVELLEPWRSLELAGK